MKDKHAFKFLQDVIPPVLPLSEAMQIHRKELQEKKQENNAKISVENDEKESDQLEKQADAPKSSQLTAPGQKTLDTMFAPKRSSVDASNLTRVSIEENALPPAPFAPYQMPAPNGFHPFGGQYMGQPMHMLPPSHPGRPVHMMPQHMAYPMSHVPMNNVPPMFPHSMQPHMQRPMQPHVQYSPIQPVLTSPVHHPSHLIHQSFDMNPSAPAHPSANERLQTSLNGTPQIIAGKLSHEQTTGGQMAFE